MRKYLTALAFLAILTPAANAASAAASVSLNVRTNPGTQHRVVDTLYPGERVTVTECYSNWCYIQHRGPDGWVSANYLTRASSNRRGIPDFNINQRSNRRHRHHDDPCDFDSSTAFHMEFGLYFTPLAKYCRHRNR